MRLPIDSQDAATAREVGRLAGDACAEKAERSTFFDREVAMAFVVQHLQRHGACWGEDIVQAAIDTGREQLAGHDLRCWGPVFGGLSKSGQIVCLRSDGVRRRGHGTTGAKQWGLPS